MPSPLQLGTPLGTSVTPSQVQRPERASQKAWRAWPAAAQPASFAQAFTMPHLHSLPKRRDNNTRTVEGALPNL